MENLKQYIKYLNDLHPFILNLACDYFKKSKLKVSNEIEELIDNIIFNFYKKVAGLEIYATKDKHFAVNIRGLEILFTFPNKIGLDTEMHRIYLHLGKLKDVFRCDTEDWLRNVLVEYFNFDKKVFEDKFKDLDKDMVSDDEASLIRKVFDLAFAERLKEKL